MLLVLYGIVCAFLLLGCHFYSFIFVASFFLLPALQSVCILFTAQSWHLIALISPIKDYGVGPDFSPHPWAESPWVSIALITTICMFLHAPLSWVYTAVWYQSAMSPIHSNHDILFLPGPSIILVITLFIFLLWSAHGPEVFFILHLVTLF